MTQIVYYDGVLVADRKVYRSDGSIFEQTKLKSLARDGKVIHYAFSGTITECNLGERIIEADTEEERQRLIAEAYDRLKNTDVDSSYWGILVEVPADPQFAKQHKVFLVNYFGEKIEVESKGFVAVGAMSNELHTAFKVAIKLDCMSGGRLFNMIRGGDAQSNIFPMTIAEWVIREATRHTYYDQNRYPLDVVVCVDD